MRKSLKLFAWLIALAVLFLLSPSKETKVDAPQERLTGLVSVQPVKDYTILTNQTVYGYTSLEQLTDSTPCIAASGLNVCTGTGSYIANNCYSFGTVVNINSIDYEVVDRMNSRYDCNTWDIWLPTYEEARQWGKRIVDIKVYN